MTRQCCFKPSQVEIGVIFYNRKLKISSHPKVYDGHLSVKMTYDHCINHITTISLHSILLMFHVIYKQTQTYWLILKSQVQTLKSGKLI